MNVNRLYAMGWRPRIGLEDGIAQTYRWFLDNRAHARTGSATEAVG
jgi:nucleoside-diphosphate-sugar epimerase